MRTTGVPLPEQVLQYYRDVPAYQPAVAMPAPPVERAPVPTSKPFLLPGNENIPPVTPGLPQGRDKVFLTPMYSGAPLPEARVMTPGMPLPKPAPVNGGQWGALFKFLTGRGL